jgi:hypothetical protein
MTGVTPQPQPRRLCRYHYPRNAGFLAITLTSPMGPVSSLGQVITPRLVFLSSGEFGTPSRRSFSWESGHSGLGFAMFRTVGNRLGNRRLCEAVRAGGSNALHRRDCRSDSNQRVP